MNMNRHERRRAEARQRKTRQQHRSSVPLKNSGTKITNCSPLPDNIKTDIAKTVRSIDWALMDGRPAGVCFFRTMSGWFTLTRLGIAARAALGGMVYRVGPDERRDVVVFCGLGNAGARINGHFIGHYFIVSDDDEIIDFSVGDWRLLAAPGGLQDVELAGAVPLGSIHWTVSDTPEFFWGRRDSFAPVRGSYTPELGRAYYTGFNGHAPDWNVLLEDFQPYLTNVAGHIDRTLEFYALKERVWAHFNGHTAVRLSALAAIAADRDLAARAVQAAAASKLQDRLVVLRGQVELTPEVATEILAEGLAAI